MGIIYRKPKIIPLNKYSAHSVTFFLTCLKNVEYETILFGFYFYTALVGTIITTVTLCYNNTWSCNFGLCISWVKVPPSTGLIHWHKVSSQYVNIICTKQALGG